MKRIFSLSLTVLVFGQSLWAANAGSSSGKIVFNRDIRPILSENCFRCHGPDPGSRKEGLRLDRPEGLFGKRDNGVVVSPGKPQESLMIRRINTKDADDLMPPPKSLKKLTPQQKVLLTEWVKEGAPWDPHWSLIAPKRPVLPKVRDAKWVKNPIDNFILARLEQERLPHSAEADRRTLARRLSLDLRGLPPTPEEVDAFVKDKAPEAYEKLVDKWLESPRWGEHRARSWLDGARYADTHGLHFDNYREMWPYRDWVINAFNKNMPFDQFTIEQLAGDLLPNPTLAQRIATGFHRCNITTNEGGTIPEENEANYARDRVEATGQVWLGVTIGCTVCHDHKFDPFTQKEFYQLTAFFRNTTQSALDGNIAETPPVIVVPSEADVARWNALPAEIETARRIVATHEKEVDPEVQAWREKLNPKDFEQPVQPDDLELYLPLRSDEGSTVRNEAQTGNAALPLPETAEWKRDNKIGPFLLLNGQTAVELGNVADVDRNEAFSYGAWVKPSEKVEAAAVISRMDEDSDLRGWDLWIERKGRRPAVHLVDKWPDKAISVVATEDVLKPKEWNHLFVSYSGKGKAAGVVIYVNGIAIKTKVEKDSLKESIRTKVPTRLGARSKGGFLTGGGLQDVRFYRRKLGAEEVLHLAAVGDVRALALGLGDTKNRKAKAREYYIRYQDPKGLELNEQVAQLEMEKKSIQKRSPVTHVMQEKTTPPIARVLYRGQYDQPREEVKPAVLSALHPMPKDAPANRLGLALWLMAPDNPLTARVTVNRYWQEVFGTGLVRSSGDFGIMGESPSHPELLDWLAVEFRESGWNVKKMFRLMVTSAAYRQAAIVTKEKYEKDPQNRFLSYGPRFRLEAEMIRDSALAASGLLSEKIGGPSVKPYQPSGVWEAVGMDSSNTKNYKNDKGEKLYRRSLYTFWKRQAPPPSMEIFNAPSRENCVIRRERTNTPLQALATLNDPQYIEAARHLAQNAITSGSPNFEGRVDYMTRRLLARSFRKEELAVIKKSIDRFDSYYQAHPDDAKAVIAVGDSVADPKLAPPLLASWTMVANQLMNLDEVLNK